MEFNEQSCGFAFFFQSAYVQAFDVYISNLCVYIFCWDIKENKHCFSGTDARITKLNLPLLKYKLAMNNVWSSVRLFLVFLVQNCIKHTKSGVKSSYFPCLGMSSIHALLCMLQNAEMMWFWIWVK